MNDYTVTESLVRDEQETSSFYGYEVENTVAKNLFTLFIAGPGWTAPSILGRLRPEVQNIYLAANHSYDACDWVSLALELLDTPNYTGSYVTLEQPLTKARSITDIQNPRFIPVISVHLDQAMQCNPNTALKLDVDLQNITNPGVWTHALKDLLDPAVFTPWSAYSKDKE